MAAKNVGTLIYEGRTAKKLSQTALANAVGGLSGSDIGKAERGEKELSQTQLKAVAKAIGVTQKSLLEAPKGGTAVTSAKKTAATSSASSAKSTTAKKTTAAKTSTAKTSTAKTSTAKTSGTAKKTTASSAKKTGTAKTTSSSTALSPTEKKLIELYRSASSDDKKLATRILKGEKLEISDLMPMLMANSGGSEDGMLGALLGKLQGLVK